MFQLLAAISQMGNVCIECHDVYASVHVSLDEGFLGDAQIDSCHAFHQNGVFDTQVESNVIVEPLARIGLLEETWQMGTGYLKECVVYILPLERAVSLELQDGAFYVDVLFDAVCLA